MVLKSPVYLVESLESSKTELTDVQERCEKRHRLLQQYDNNPIND